MPSPTPDRRRPRRARQAGAVAVSVAAHVAIGVAIALSWTYATPLPEMKPMAVSLVEIPKPPAPQPAPTPALVPGPPVKAPPKHASSAPPKPAPSPLATRPAPQTPATGVSNGLSDAQIAGAASADSGGGGGGGGSCDMIRRLQSALRKDPLVQAAAARTGGRAMLIWDGDWIQSQDEDGKGMAAVREAVMWEVAFAPPACRAESVRGLILISLNGGSGGPRLALGSPAWRWSDLLATRENLTR
jgi:hypothetical protein